LSRVQTRALKSSPLLAAACRCGAEHGVALGSGLWEHPGRRRDARRKPRERTPDLVFAQTDPYLAPLRTDPRFGPWADSIDVPRPREK